MKYINRNNKAIEVSTTELHFDELNNFPIEVIVETINFWVPTLTVAKAIKYTNWQPILNLFENIDCLSDEFFTDIPPFGLLECSPGESVLAQNKLLKKLRQVQSVMLAKGQYSASTKYITSLDYQETTKLLSYRTGLLRDTLHNASYEDCIKVMAGINGSEVGDAVLELILESKEDFEYFMLNDMESVTEDESIDAANSLLNQLDLYAREPWHVGFEPVNRSNEVLIERKFVSVVGEAYDDLEQSCRVFPIKDLAKVLMVINDELKEGFYGQLPDEQVETLKVAVINLESDTLKKWKSRSLFNNKPEAEVKAFIEKQHEYHCQRAYSHLCRLQTLIKKHQFCAEEVLLGFENDPNSPLSFTQLASYQDNAIRYMLRLAHTDDLVAAFYYSQNAPELNKIYNIVPTIQRRFKEAYQNLDLVVTPDLAIKAQQKLIEYLEAGSNIPEPNLKSPDENNKPLEPRESVPKTISIFNKSDLEETAALRELTGEYGAELANEVLKKGPEKRIVFATESMLDELDLMKEQFPNFEEVIEELYICLKLSLLNTSRIEFPVINLQSLPGCGKTEFIRTLAKRLKLEFFDLNIGTCHSKADLIGGSSQFKSSTMGAVGKGVLLKTDTFNPIMFLDELCLAKSDGEWAITPSLLSVFDIEQRKNVKEQFLDLNFDCSGVLFFTTTNNYENLLPALKSRLTNFDIKPPSKMEMKKICQNIYTSYLKEKKFQRHFEQQLSFDITESLSLLTPREAKNTLISAIRKAFVRSADCSELAQVTLQDIAIRKGSVCEQQPVGFIH